MDISESYETFLNLITEEDDWKLFYAAHKGIKEFIRILNEIFPKYEKQLKTL